MKKELWCEIRLFNQAPARGRLSREMICGFSFLKLEIPQDDGNFRVRYYGVGAIHSMYPMSQEEVLANPVHVRVISRGTLVGTDRPA